MDLLITTFILPSKTAGTYAVLYALLENAAQVVQKLKDENVVYMNDVQKHKIIQLLEELEHFTSQMDKHNQYTHLLWVAYMINEIMPTLSVPEIDKLANIYIKWYIDDNYDVSDELKIDSTMKQIQSVILLSNNSIYLHHTPDIYVPILQNYKNIYEQKENAIQYILYHTMFDIFKIKRQNQIPSNWFPHFIQLVTNKYASKPDLLREKMLNLYSTTVYLLPTNGHIKNLLHHLSTIELDINTRQIPDHIDNTIDAIRYAIWNAIQLQTTDSTFVLQFISAIMDNINEVLEQLQFASNLLNKNILAITLTKLLDKLQVPEYILKHMLYDILYNHFSWKRKLGQIDTDMTLMDMIDMNNTNNTVPIIMQYLIAYKKPVIRNINLLELAKQYGEDKIITFLGDVIFTGYYSFTSLLTLLNIIHTLFHASDWVFQYYTNLSEDIAASMIHIFEDYFQQNNDEELLDSIHSGNGFDE